MTIDKFVEKNRIKDHDIIKCDPLLGSNQYFIPSGNEIYIDELEKKCVNNSKSNLSKIGFSPGTIDTFY